MSKNVTGPQVSFGASPAERHAAEMNHRDCFFRTEGLSRDQLLGLTAKLGTDTTLMRVIAERGCALQDIELTNRALEHVDPNNNYSEEWSEVFTSASGGQSAAEQVADELRAGLGDPTPAIDTSGLLNPGDTITARDQQGVA
jgi:hypothetical protein